MPWPQWKYSCPLCWVGKYPVAVFRQQVTGTEWSGYLNTVHDQCTAAIRCGSSFIDTCTSLNERAEGTVRLGYVRYVYMLYLCIYVRLLRNICEWHESNEYVCFQWDVDLSLTGLSPDLQSMEQIRRIMRPTDVPDQGLLCDLLWSDPDKETMGWGENDRGVSFTFGAEVVAKFLHKHDLDLICRAHQVSRTALLMLLQCGCGGQWWWECYLSRSGLGFVKGGGSPTTPPQTK